MGAHDLFWFPRAVGVSVEQDTLTSDYVPTKRSKKLVEMLQICKAMHERADPVVLATLERLIEQIESGPIAVADRKDRTVFYGRRYILQSFAELFDPVLLALMPPGSTAFSLANSIDGLLPLRSSLQKRENCKTVANHLEHLNQRIKIFIGCSTLQEITLRDSIHCIREILDVMDSVLPYETLRWCSYCFRRAELSSNYCQLHRPNNDSQYRVARRVYQSLATDVLQRREKYRGGRQALGESFEVISEEVELVHAMPSGSVAVVSRHIAHLTKLTPVNWPEASIVWEYLVKENFPKLATIIATNMPTKHDSWGGWVEAVRQDCNDPHENTTHPFWVLQILSCAQDWLSAKSASKDRRRTDTAQEVKTLWFAGMTNATKIAQQLGVSRQYVARVVKRYKLRREDS